MKVTIKILECLIAINFLACSVIFATMTTTVSAPTSPHIIAAASAGGGDLLDTNVNDETTAPSSISLTNQILCGYQGWFNFPGDGSPLDRWKHWFAVPGNNSTAKELTVEMFPITTEYDEEDLKESEILLHNDHGGDRNESEGGGTRKYAKFFSSARPKVVLKHFEWMKMYGITGAFHSRFMQGLHMPKDRESKTMVLRNVMNAAEATGRSFAVSYDISGQKITNGILDDLKADWMRLVDEEGITQSTRYIRQNGLPVLNVYGIGFVNRKIDDTDKMAGLIDWFQHTAPERYRVFFLGGVPGRWRDGKGDSRGGPAWQGIYDSMDGIQAWHVGRWQTKEGFERYFSNVISKDATYCASKGILYMPTMWPGFSWHNLQKEKKDNNNKQQHQQQQVQPKAPEMNKIPRLGGEFLWKQAHAYASHPNIHTIWMAQFDEVDEGTAIFKVAARASDLPAEASWLSLDADGKVLPEDWYLRLAGEAQLMLAGEREITENIPIRPDESVGVHHTLLLGDRQGLPFEQVVQMN